jgi:hypothetical protein
LCLIGSEAVLRGDLWSGQTPETMTTYFVINRHNATTCRINASCWEQLQAMFRVGILMPDGDLATGIGRCQAAEFEQRAACSGIKVLRDIGWEVVA